MSPLARHERVQLAEPAELARLRRGRRRCALGAGTAAPPAGTRASPAAPRRALRARPSPRTGRPSAGRALPMSSAPARPLSSTAERALLAHSGLPAGRGASSAAQPPPVAARIVIQHEQRSHLKEAHVGHPARGIVGGHVEQRAQQGRAQQRLVLRQRVLEHRRAPARIVAREPQAIVKRRRRERPAHHLVQAPADERVGRAAAQPLGGREAPVGAAARRQRGRQLPRARGSRATSSIRSASRVTSSRRTAGTVTSRAPSSSEPPSAPRSREVECPQDLGLARAWHRHPEDRVAPSRSRSWIVRAERRLPRHVDRAGHARVAPHSSIISRVASACACMHCSGAKPFSKRPEASLRSPSVQEVRWMLGPLQLATSIRTLVVSACTSERSPPMIPAIEVGPSASSITTISPSSVRTWPSSVVTCSPSRARLTVRRPPATRSRSKACSGWPVSSIT